MLRKRCNAVISHCLVRDDEIDEIKADLPAAVTEGLEAALDLEGRVLRYDMPSQSAYCLERLSPTLSIWIWDGISTYDEAAKLLTPLVEPDGPIDEAAATTAYVLATGRPVPDVA